MQCANVSKYIIGYFIYNISQSISINRPKKNPNDLFLMEENIFLPFKRFPSTEHAECMDTIRILNVKEICFVYILTRCVRSNARI